MEIVHGLLKRNFGHGVCPWKQWKISELSMILASQTVVVELRFILSLERIRN